MNVTQKKVKKVQQHRSHPGNKRTVIKTIQAESFFNFFSPPEGTCDRKLLLSLLLLLLLLLLMLMARIHYTCLPIGSAYQVGDFPVASVFLVCFLTFHVWLRLTTTIKPT